MKSLTLKPYWIRLVLAISLDGRLARPNGGKSFLGGKGDRRVLEEALAWSDAALIGAGTLRAHQSTCLIHSPDLINTRLKQGKAKQPISVVIAKESNQSPQWLYFQQPIERWLISNQNYLGLNSSTKIIRQGFDRHLSLKPSWPETLQQLSELGISKLLLLGGAKLLYSFLQADQIDELQLTITPQVIGGSYSWVPEEITGLPKALSEKQSWTLQLQKVLDDQEIMLKYIRNRNEKD